MVGTNGRVQRGRSQSLESHSPSGVRGTTVGILSISMQNLLRPAGIFSKRVVMPRGYRRLTRKTTNKTIPISPRLPGQINQPPPLEYPATKHPESPEVATDAVKSTDNLLNKVRLEATPWGFRTGLLHFSATKRSIRRSSLPKPVIRPDW
jgi:hypothetical protein